MNIQSNVDDINKLTDEIAEINVQILSAEVGEKQANDLRDQRDELIKKLSGLADIHYFETKRGTYTVLIGPGYPIVEGDRSWDLEVRSGKVSWIGSADRSVELGTEDVQHGELGGWLDIKSRISPRDTTLLTSSVSNTTSGKAVRGFTNWDDTLVPPQAVPLSSSTRWDQIDGVTVSGDFSIQFSGTDQTGQPVTGVFQYIQGPPEQNATIADFLAFVQNTFRGAGTQQLVDARVNDEGRIIIEDLAPGTVPISFQIDAISGNVSGLDLGKFDGSYPLNYLEELNRVGREVIKEVNRQHSQGVGLIPLQETTGVYTAINTSEPIGLKSSGLEFSSDVTDGQFEVWLYDSQGQIIDYDPSTPEVNEPAVINVLRDFTSMEDLRAAIDGVNGLTARILNGRLVVQADGNNNVAGFAFGKDTSGALLTLGMNAFFTGTDAASIGLNQTILDDQRLVAAAQVEPRGSDHVSNIIPVQDLDRPLGLNFQNGRFTLWIYDENGYLVDQDPDTPGSDPVYINVDPDHTSVGNVVDAINDIDGLTAEVKDGLLRVQVVNDKWSGVTLGDDTSGILAYMGVDQGHGPAPEITDFVSPYPVADPAAQLASAASGLDGYAFLNEGQNFTVNAYDVNGALVSSTVLSLNPGDSLNALATTLNGLAFVNASVNVDNQLVIQVVDAGGGEASISLDDDGTNVAAVLGLDGGIEAREPVTDVGQSLGTTASGLQAYGAIRGGSFEIRRYDSSGNLILSSVVNINVDPAATTLDGLRSTLDALAGVTATIRPVDVGGQTYYRLAISATAPGEHVVLDKDTSGLLEALGLGQVSTDVRGVYQMDRTNEPLNNFDLGINDGNFNVYLYDDDGYMLAPSLAGSVANIDTSTAAPVTAATVWSNVQGASFTGPGPAPYPFAIRFSGKDQLGNLVTGTYTAVDPALDTIGGFLTAIEQAFTPTGPPYDVNAYLDAQGRLVVESNIPGQAIGFQIDDIRAVNPGDSVSGLDFGLLSGAFSVELEAAYDGLSDVAERVAQIPGLKADTANGRMNILTEGRVARFVLADDTTGMLNALDLFTPRGGLMSPANNLNALALRDISRNTLSELNDSTLNEAYQGLVGTVGIHSRGFQLDFDFATAAVNELEARRDEVSGVSLDEEMANLLKFQHSYSAAAKLLKAADEMFLTLLEAKT